MDEKINLTAVAQYSEEFAAKLTDDHFRSNERINGNQILNACDVRQVNLLVLYEIFASWQEQSSRNRSAYFDYSVPDVRDAMEQLMNTLSNHISVARDDFFSLLKKATYNTLLLIVDPYDFYADLIENQSEPISVDGFRGRLKYLKINRAPLERLLEKLSAHQGSSLSTKEVFGILDNILEEVNFSPEDVDPYVSKFSAVVPLAIERFYQPRTSEPTQEESDDPDFETPTPATTPEIRVSPSGIQPPAAPTLNDRHSPGTRQTLADNFKRISNIKEHLTINQKFMFTKVLFHGDFDLFSRAVDDLDRQDTLTGAMKYLEMNYGEWDRESEEFHEFMELIEKRFTS